MTTFAQALKEEDEHHIRNGLTEDELEIYDLLRKEQMTKDEEKKVRLAAKALIIAKRKRGPSEKGVGHEWH